MFTRFFPPWSDEYTQFPFSCLSKIHFFHVYVIFFFFFWYYFFYRWLWLGNKEDKFWVCEIFFKIYIRDTRRYVLPKSIDLCIPLRGSTTTHHSRKLCKQKSVYATFPTDEFSTNWKIWQESTFTLNLALFARNRRDRLNFNFCQLPMGRVLLKNGAVINSKSRLLKEIPLIHATSPLPYKNSPLQSYNGNGCKVWV